VVLSILIAWQLTPIFVLNGADDNILPYITQYMTIWLIGLLPLMFTQVCSSTFRSLGDTATSATIAITMTLVNLILDPLLIFGLGPFPQLGMQGAAWATVIAVLISCLIGLYKLGYKERLLLWTLPKANLFRQNFRELVSIAIPAVLANIIVPLTGAVMIGIAARFGPDVTAGFGVGARIEALSLMIVYALSATLPVFIGQNLGANKPERVLQALTITFRFVFVLQLVIYLLLAVLAKPIAALFSTAPTVQDTIISFLRIVPICYGLSGIIVLINVSMNVLGHPRIALYINILRLLLFYTPMALIGAKLFAIKGMFVGIAVGHLCAFLLATLLLIRVLKQVKVIPK
jgi:putative MATE family efflux protein